MVSTNADLKKYFQTSLDKYGDHYSQPVEPGRLKDILDKIDDEKVENSMDTRVERNVEEMQGLLEDL